PYTTLFRSLTIPFGANRVSFSSDRIFSVVTSITGFSLMRGIWHPQTNPELTQIKQGLIGRDSERSLKDEFYKNENEPRINTDEHGFGEIESGIKREGFTRIPRMNANSAHVFHHPGTMQ